MAGMEDPAASAYADLPALKDVKTYGSETEVAHHELHHRPKHTADDELPITSNRNGTWQSTMFHNVTAMVGAGVLGLPNTFVYLGWVGGLIVLVAALIISWYTFILLVKMHEQPATDEEEETGVACKTQRFIRMNRYIELSNYAFGQRWGWVIQPFQILLLWGTALCYNIAGGKCLHHVYVNAGGSTISLSEFMLVFSSVSLLVAQITNFGDFILVSAMGAIVSVFYTTIAMGMSGSFPTANRELVSYKTGANGSPIAVMMGIFNALTTVMFAFGGHNIALEIQASLPGGSCPEDTTVPRMMIGVHVAFVYAGIVYFGVSILGWWAYGNAVSGNVIFSLGGPLAIQSLCCMLVVLHVIASYQIYSFPLYDMMEGKMMRMGYHMTWWRRCIIRCSYVLFTTFIACLVPFFGDIMGLIGAAGVTPTTYVFPCMLWLKLKNPSYKTLTFWSCWFIISTITVVGVLGFIGSVYEIIIDASTYKTFSR